MTDGLILRRSESWQLGLARRVNFCLIKMILFSGYFQIPDQDLNLRIQISFKEQHFILPASRLLLIPGCCPCLSRLLEEWGVLAVLSPAWRSCGVSGAKAGWEPFSEGCAVPRCSGVQGTSLSPWTVPVTWHGRIVVGGPWAPQQPWR